MKVLSAKQYGKKLKATIQSTGRLGFTEPTAIEFGLDKPTWIKIAAEEKDEEIMYLILLDTEDEDAFPVCKAGDYYYLQTKYLFDAIGYDYVKKKIMFDVVRMRDFDDECGGRVYKMKRRFGKNE